MKKEYRIKSLNEIGEVAEKFIADYSDKRIFAFYGSMGVGKTTFIKSLCKKLGVEDTVNSPSFAIVNEYNTQDNLSVYHFDFYRIESEEEAYDFGYENYFYSDSYCFIEWPERIDNLLPNTTIELHFSELEDGTRKIEVK